MNMNRDTEAAWPLTTDTGYYPGPASAPAPGPLMPVAPTNPYAPAQPILAQPPANRPQAISPGLRLGYLAVILGIAIPLTAIATNILGFIGLVVTWGGILAVSFLAFGPTWRIRGN